MRLFMTPAGEEAWYSALARNVRMQITRFEIGALDVYTLSGAKQSGLTTSQFRANNYLPNWQPDFAALRANDPIVHEGSAANIGYWMIQQNDGGLIIRIPATAPSMQIGNVRIYAKNTGPYPYATMAQGATNNLLTDPDVQDATKWLVGSYPTPTIDIGLDVSWTRVTGLEALVKTGHSTAIKLDAADPDWNKAASQRVSPNWNTNLQSIEAGLPVVFAGNARNDSNQALSFTCEWLDVNNNFLGSSPIITIAPGAGLKSFSKRLTPPANAVKTNIGFMNGNGSDTNTPMTGVMYVGELTVRRGAVAYKRYEQVYDDEHGGEVMLFAGFASIADMHWQYPAAFPHFVDIRLSMHADGMFNVLNRSQFAFEQTVSVFDAETEADLLSPAANAYGCAVVKSHSKTHLPAVFYRTHGAKQWVGYPLNESFVAEREFPKPIADANLDSGLLDKGLLNPPPVEVDTPEGTVISSQPRYVELPDLAFTKKDVGSWTASTATRTVALRPNTGQPYVATVRVADLAFLGTNQQLFFIHNGTRYRLCAGGQAYDTPPIIFRDGDTVKLEGTLQGPISSLAGNVYAQLNEAPISNDADNKPTWLLGKVSMHINATIPAKPDRMVFGLIGRRIDGFAWDEQTPDQYVSGLGHDMYGVPREEPVTFRVVSSDANKGGTSFMYGAGQMATDKEPSYLRNTYRDPQGNPVIRRGVTGLPGTEIRLIHNGVDVGPLSTLTTPEGELTITVKDNDRIGLRVVLVGRAANPSLGLSQVLPAVAIAIEAVSSQGLKWFEAAFDIAATFGPDGVTPPAYNPMPTLPNPSSLPQLLGSSTFPAVVTELINKIVVDSVVSVGDPTDVYGPWHAFMAAPNPTLAATNIDLVLEDIVTTGSGISLALEKFDPSGASAPIVIFNGAPVAGQIVTLTSGDAYRARVTFTQPDRKITAKLKLLTESGYVYYTISTEVRSA